MMPVLLMPMTGTVCSPCFPGPISGLVRLVSLRVYKYFVKVCHEFSNETDINFGILLVCFAE